MMADNSKLVNAIRDTILLINKEGIILDFYAHPDTVLWRDPKTIVNSNVEEVKEIQNVKKKIISCLEKGTRDYIDFFLITDGQKRYFQTRLEPVDDTKLYAVIKEITAKKRAERALASSEKKFHALYNSSPGMFHSVDKHGRILDVGDYLLEKTGYQREEVIGKLAMEFLTKESVKFGMHEVFPKYVNDGYCKDVPFQFIKKNGDILDILLSSVVVKDDNGKFLKSLVVLNDVTILRKTESSLKASEEKFREIFNSITDVYFKTNSKDEIVIISPSVEKISGFKPSEFIGKKSSEFISKKRNKLIRQQLSLNGRINNYNISFKFGNGIERIFSVNAEATLDDKGKLIGVTGIMRDITERKLVEDKISEVAKRYHDLFEYGNDAIFIADSKIQNILDINKKAEELLGYSREELLKLKLIDIRHKADIQNFKKKLRELKKEGHIISEAVLQKKDGTIVNVEYSARIIRVDGKLLYQSFTRDITKRKREERIAQLNKAILEMMTQEGDLKEILNHTCEGMEQIFEGMVCSILLYDDINNYLTYGAGPSLPKYYTKALEKFEIGPNQGSCGTAAYLKKEIIVSDITKDPLWEKYGDFAARANLKACTSVPILSSENQILGTYAVYFREQKEPTPAEMETIRNFGYLLSAAIENSKNKQALVASEKRYRTLVKNAPVAIIIHTNGIIKFANNEALKIARAKDESELLERNTMEFVQQEYHDLVKENRASIKSGAESQRSEQRFIRLDGTSVDVEVMGSPSTFMGKPSLQIIFYDITERKDAERRLIESENRYRQLVEHAPIGIVIHDSDKIRYVNAEMLNVAHAESKDQLEGKSVMEFVPNAFKLVVHDRIKEISASGFIPRQEQQFKCVDGNIIDILVAGSPIELKGETLIQSAFYDITEKKNAERKLIDSEEQYRSLNDSISDAIIISNKSGNIISWNHGAEKIFGYKELEVLNKPIKVIIPESYKNAHESAFNNFFTKKKKKASKGIYEFKGMHKKGHEFPIELSIANWKSGGETYFSALIRDISERKLAEERQNKLNDFLIKQNKQLEEFAHIASHNLRAPIANIAALLKLHEIDQAPENSKFVLDQLGIVSTNLNETINELTDVIKTSWELNKQKQKLNFNTICKKVIQSVSRAVINTDATINTDFDQAPDIWYPKVYLESILQNLISNALKYRHPSRKPKIEIRTTHENGYIVLTIADNGLGINMEKHANKLFGLRKTFHKNEDARGVGLFITKAQVESMGGNISVSSEVEKGSVFTINFGEM